MKRKIIWIFSSLFFLNFSVRLVSIVLYMLPATHVSCSIIRKSVCAFYCAHWINLRADDEHTQNKSFNKYETKHYLTNSVEDKKICSLNFECVYCFVRRVATATVAVDMIASLASDKSVLCFASCDTNLPTVYISNVSML